MSNTLLLDTDVASYLFKNSPRANGFRPFLESRQPTLAFVSVAELYKWTLKRRWGQKKVERLESALRRYVIVPYVSSNT